VVTAVRLSRNSALQEWSIVVTFATLLKPHHWLPTFSDAIALVRSRLWAYWTFHLSLDDPDMVKVPRSLLERFTDLLAYAA